MHYVFARMFPSSINDRMWFTEPPLHMLYVPGLDQPGQAVVGRQLARRDALQEDQDKDVPLLHQQTEGGQPQLQGAPVTAQVVSTHHTHGVAAAWKQTKKKDQ